MLDWTALFPKQPYPIQLELASTIYDTLQTQREKLLLVESPTGTGKTFSLLVPAMHWLIHNRAKLQQTQTPKSLPSWLKKEVSKGEELVLKKTKKLKEMVSLIARVSKEDKSHCRSTKPISIDDIEDFGEEIEGAKAVKRNRNEAYIERQLQNQEGQLPRIIFVSRTHSQLQQVISSVRLISQQMEKLRKEGQAQLQTVHIASKEHLCINRAVNGQGNVAEKCKHLLKNSKCDYYDRESYKDFFNKDSEEGLFLGRSSSVCSYYGVRNILDCADIICLPYASLLTDETRRRSGISIRNAILVFDEGHNIMEFDRNAKSFEVYYRQIAELCQGIDEYVAKYKQISAKTALILEHWLTVLRSLLRVGKDRTHAHSSSYSRISVLEFLLALGITSLRIHEIKQYVDLTDFDQKIVALCPARGSRGAPLTVRVIRNVLDFMMQLSSVREGQESVVLLKGRAEEEEGSLSILCLESQELSEIVKQSRLTIFAGGTMEPLSDFQSLMDSFPHKILRFKHVVKREQCTIYTVARFETKEIKFTFEGLKTSRLWLGSVIRVVVGRVLKRTEAGGGVVLFVQNYQIVELFRSVLQDVTEVFYDEPAKLKGGTEQSVFEKYSAAIYASRKAVLVSVMGGRLSEGINFNDSLARALVVFGLPYANLMAPQVKEMMGYRGRQGQLYYENLCMKSLNQTIGRAIRHVDDYADCFLIDARFKSIGGRLSEWMRQRVVEIERLEDV